eukprot:14192-Heterococcus_DN1.PRE.1
MVVIVLYIIVLFLFCCVCVCAAVQDTKQLFKAIRALFTVGARLTAAYLAAAMGYLQRYIACILVLSIEHSSAFVTPVIQRAGDVCTATTALAAKGPGYQQSWEPEKRPLGDYSSYLKDAQTKGIGKPHTVELWGGTDEQSPQQRLLIEDRKPLPNGDMPVTIKVIGVGGAGGNAINGMVSTTKNLQGVEFIAMNTDQQALFSSLAGVKLPLGQSSTGGLGAGGRPEVGASAAMESKEAIAECVMGADMVFITAGMGGGTGTGAAPIVAQIAKGLGCLTVGVVTSPFEFEGRSRGRQAAAGLAALRSHVDALLVVANDRLLQIIPSRMSMTDAFLVADDILRQGVIDFADVTSVIKDSGAALIGIGTGVGPTRAQ